jgi:hypothetical protein
VVKLQRRYFGHFFVSMAGCFIRVYTMVVLKYAVDCGRGPTLSHHNESSTLRVLWRIVIRRGILAEGLIDIRKQVRSVEDCKQVGETWATCYNKLYVFCCYASTVRTEIVPMHNVSNISGP